MPAKKSTFDWKRLLQGEGQGPLTSEAVITEILSKGARSSEGNEGKFVPATSKDDILKAMEANRKLRNMPKKNPTYHPKLKGLFGGGS